MNLRRSLNLAAILTGALIVLALYGAWRSANPLPLTAEEIRARTAAEMERIEARAAEIERNAAAP